MRFLKVFSGVMPVLDFGVVPCPTFFGFMQDPYSGIVTSPPLETVANYYIDNVNVIDSMD